MYAPFCRKVFVLSFDTLLQLQHRVFRANGYGELQCTGTLDIQSHASATSICARHGKCRETCVARVSTRNSQRLRPPKTRTHPPTSIHPLHARIIKNSLTNSWHIRPRLSDRLRGPAPRVSYHKSAVETPCRDSRMCRHNKPNSGYATDKEERIRTIESVSYTSFS